MTKYWLGVASKDHVKIGIAGSFCQLCHGKKAPLTRMKKGDKLLYYAPKESRTKGLPCQKIIAVGTLTDELVYQVEMSPGFIPYRRNVAYENHLSDIPLETLKTMPLWHNYQFKLRFGHFEIEKNLYVAIYEKMNAR